jgi:polysaccharide export outer membrane protein
MRGMRTNHLRVSFCLLLPMVVGGCPSGAVRFDYSTLPDPNKSPYKIQSGDRINIRVLRANDTNTGVFIVRPDGYISLALGGEVMARGLTTEDVRRAVVNKLAEFITDADKMIAVSLEQVQGIRYSVIGEVNRPGFFDAPRYPTVLEALANAGGPNNYAQSDAIYVLREQQRIPFSYQQTIKDPSGNRNFYLIGGDVVVVP